MSFQYDIAHQLYSRKRRQEWLAIFIAGQFLVLSLIRSESLISGIVYAMRVHNYIVAFLSIRAHYETLGGLGHALDAIRKFAHKTYDFRQLHARILRLQLGSRRSRIETETDDKKVVERILGPNYKDQPLFKAYNVLTLIDATDKLLFKDTDQRGLRETYDILSEYCHPNSDGLHVGTSLYLDDEARVEFASGFDHINILHDAAMVLPRFIELYDEAWGLLSLDQIRAIKIRRARP
jgi:hypothetical protein